MVGGGSDESVQTRRALPAPSKSSSLFLLLVRERGQDEARRGEKARIFGEARAQCGLPAKTLHEFQVTNALKRCCCLK